jgi:hypothetical protein
MEIWHYLQEQVSTRASAGLISTRFRGGDTIELCPVAGLGLAFIVHDVRWHGWFSYSLEGGRFSILHTVIELSKRLNGKSPNLNGPSHLFHPALWRHWFQNAAILQWIEVNWWVSMDVYIIYWSGLWVVSLLVFKVPPIAQFLSISSSTNY